MQKTYTEPEDNSSKTLNSSNNQPTSYKDKFPQPKNR